MSAAYQEFCVALLRARGVIRRRSPPARITRTGPWFVALLQGVAGWLAGIFLLVFMGSRSSPNRAARSSRW